MPRMHVGTRLWSDACDASLSSEPQALVLLHQSSDGSDAPAPAPPQLQNIRDAARFVRCVHHVFCFRVCGWTVVACLVAAFGPTNSHTRMYIHTYV